MVVVIQEPNRESPEFRQVVQRALSASSVVQDLLRTGKGCCGQGLCGALERGLDQRRKDS